MTWLKEFENDVLDLERTRLGNRIAEYRALEVGMRPLTDAARRADGGLAETIPEAVWDKLDADERRDGEGPGLYGTATEGARPNAQGL